jgi:hypothetical protein
MKYFQATQTNQIMNEFILKEEFFINLNLFRILIIPKLYIC